MHDLTSDAIGLTLLLVTVIVAWRVTFALAGALRRVAGGRPPEDVLTFCVAALATAAASQGMLRFFGDHLAMPAWMRWCTFSLFELAMMACALRGRRKIRDPKVGSAGVDGVLVWAMASVSAFLSATDASGLGALARMLFPYVAAGAWELLLSYERRRSGGRTIHWRFTPERILVRLGVAEPTDRTATEVDAHRRITRLARAAKRVRILQAAGVDGRKLARALHRLDAAMEAAVEHAGLATEPGRQDALVAQLGALYGAAGLAELAPAAPWAGAVTRPARIWLVRGEQPAEVRGAGPDDVPVGVPRDVPAESGETLDERPEREPIRDVPGPVPAELEKLVKRARRKFARDLEAGTTPGIAALKSALNIGQDKAYEVRAHLRQERSA